MKVLIQVLEDREVDIIEALEQGLFIPHFYFIRRWRTKREYLGEEDDSILVISQELVDGSVELVVLECGDLEQLCLSQERTKTKKEVIIEYLKANREKIIKITDLPGYY